MSTIRIERLPVSVANLGLLGFDHLQLVFAADGFAPQDSWFVLEGLREAGGLDGPVLGVGGVDGHTTLSAANGGLTGSALAAAIGTPQSRGSRSLSFLSPEATWSAMSAMGREIDAQGFAYVAYGLPGTLSPTVNSTSVIASILYWAGVDIQASWPTGTGFSPGWTTLLGTRAGDDLTIERDFTSLLAGWGDDTLRGSRDSRADRLFGGRGNDVIHWSEGFNYIHGGETRLDYAADGVDVIDYAGVGTIVITGNPEYIPHRTPSLTTDFIGGHDLLFSVERMYWSPENDHIIFRNGASAIPDRVMLELQGETGSGQGDIVDLADLATPLLGTVSPDGWLVIRAVDRLDQTVGIWIQEAEWIIATESDDRFYLAPDQLGIEGRGGADLIDARLVAAFTGAGPSGYDVEIDGGAGADTIVGGAGRTIVHGGAGADTFVLSSLSAGQGRVEIVIDDAASDDRVLVPYNFFNASGGGFDGSELMLLRGGVTSYADMVAFGFPSVFEFRREREIQEGTDDTIGNIRFTGRIEYTVDGSDLLIHVYSGHTEPGTDPLGNPHNYLVVETASEALIRVIDFQEGDLGLTFTDPASLTIDPNPDIDYTAWNVVVDALTADGLFLPALDLRPDAPTTRPDDDPSAGPEVSGTSGGDTIVLASAATVDAGEGDDSITGSIGFDIIDGGSGADTMAGGAGNDTYEVDAAGDVVVEAAASGRDAVIAAIDYALAAHVEDLTLAGAALVGTGNELDNRMAGNASANTLAGAGGDDALAGDYGDDTLLGGEGSDAYVYALGDGRDLVIDTGAASDTDRLVLVDAAAADVAVYALAAAPSDLVLAFSDGGSVTVRDFRSGQGIEEVLLATGETWSRADLLARLDAGSPLASAPVRAADDPYLVAASSAAVIDAALLLANDASPGGAPLHIVGVSDVVGGNVNLRPDGDLDLLAADTSAPTTFSYTVSDGQSTATARVTVGYVVNHAPTAAGTLAPVAATEHAPFSYTLPAGLFTDADGDPLELRATLADGSELPSWIDFDPLTGVVQGIPPPGSAGSLAITLSASDGLDVAATTLALTVLPGNSAPVASNDVLTAAAGAPLLIDPSALLANDTDPDGDPLVVTGVAGADHGTVEQLADGSILFTPEVGFSGLAGFSYVVSDGHGGTATAAVTIEVTATGGVFTGTRGNDTIVGTAGADTLTGGRGDDLLQGLGGNDTFLVAGTRNGFDRFEGGDGLDSILGGDGDDIIGLAPGAGSLTGIEWIDTGAGYDVLRGSSAADLIDLSLITLSGLELVDGRGGNDTLIGSAGADRMRGGSGQDILRGGAGDDVLETSGGSDLFDGGAGWDIVQGTASDDLVRLAGGPGNLAGIEAIDFGAGVDTLRGSAADDLVDLSALVVTGLELLDGAAGNDTLIGSAAADVLRGGAGNDVFVVRPGAGHDVVTDFRLGSRAAPVADILDLSGWGLASFTDVLARTTASGGDTVVTLDATTSLTLVGIRPDQLRPDDVALS